MGLSLRAVLQGLTDEPDAVSGPAGSKRVNTPLADMRPWVEIGSDLRLSLFVVVAVGPKLPVSAADFGMVDRTVFTPATALDPTSAPSRFRSRATTTCLRQVPDDHRIGRTGDWPLSDHLRQFGSPGSSGPSATARIASISSISSPTMVAPLRSGDTRKGSQT